VDTGSRKVLRRFLFMASLLSSDIASGVSPEDAEASRYFAKQIEPSKIREVREESSIVDADVRTGTKAHQVSAVHMLSLSAAVKEGLDNVIGIAQETKNKCDLHVFLMDLPSEPLASAEEYRPDEGMVQVGKEHIILLSDTRIDERSWPWFFDQRPSVGDISAAHHRASVFNRGIKDAFNKLTGGVNSTMLVFAQRQYLDPSDGMTKTEHLLGRYGSSLDLGEVEEDEEDAAQRKLQMTWSIKEMKVIGVKPGLQDTKLVKFCKDTCLYAQSFPAMKNNINDIFKLLHSKAASVRSGGYDNFFAVIMGTIHIAGNSSAGRSDAPLPPPGIRHPVLQKGFGVDERETIFLYDPQATNEQVDLRELYAKSYLPASCIFAEHPAPISQVDLFVQGSKVDMTANLWDQNGKDQHEVIVEDGQGVVVARLMIKHADPDKPEYGGLDELGRRVAPDGSNYRSSPPYLAQTAGVLVALPGSGRFLSRVPCDFYKGFLFDRSPWKISLCEMIDGVRAESHTNATTLRSNFKKLLVPREFGNCHDESRLERFCKAVNQRKEKDRLYRALGAQSLAVALLTSECKATHDHSKERLEGNQRNNDVMGRIVGALLNYTLGKEMDALEAEEASLLQQKRSASKRKERASRDHTAASSSLPSAAAKKQMTARLASGSLSASSIQVRNPPSRGTEEEHYASLTQRQQKSAAQSSKARQKRVALGTAIRTAEAALQECREEYDEPSLSDADHKLFRAIEKLIANAKYFAPKER